MPSIKFDGITVAYEVAGSGTPIVFTPGGAGPRNGFSYSFAGRFSAEYTVVTWDRPNDGQSGLSIVDVESEWHMWTDCLHLLLHELELVPAYVGGGSGGFMTSLLMAVRYPDDVKGLLLQDPPTDDIEIFTQIAEGRYLNLAAAAEEAGLAGAIKASEAGGWALPLSRYVADDPEYKRALEDLGVDSFISILNKWAAWLTGSRPNVANTSDEDLRNLTTPAVVSHGFDPLHPQHSASRLFKLLPNAIWADYSSRYTAEQIERMSDYINGGDVPWSTYGAFVAPFHEEFLRRVESETFKGESKDETSRPS